MQHLDRIVGLEPEDTDVLHDRGCALSDLGRHRAAVRDFTRAIELDPDDAESYYRRGMSRGELGEHRRAIEDFGEALRLEPDHPSAAQDRETAVRLAESNDSGGYVAQE